MRRIEREVEGEREREIGALPGSEQLKLERVTLLNGFAYCHVVLAKG